jgi:hypothetical protein
MSRVICGSQVPSDFLGNLPIPRYIRTQCSRAHGRIAGRDSFDAIRLFGWYGTEEN